MKETKIAKEKKFYILSSIFACIVYILGLLTGFIIGGGTLLK